MNSLFAETLGMPELSQPRPDTDDPLSLMQSSPSPRHTHVGSLLVNDPVSMSPTVTAAVADLLSSFNEHPDTLISTVQPNTVSRKFYDRKKSGWIPVNLRLFIHSLFF